MEKEENGINYKVEYIRMKQEIEHLQQVVEQTQRLMSNSQALPILLQNAEEKLTLVEENLLQAEETIVHLQAEKRELKELALRHEQTIHSLLENNNQHNGIKTVYPTPPSNPIHQMTEENCKGNQKVQRLEHEVTTLKHQVTTLEQEITTLEHEVRDKIRENQQQKLEMEELYAQLDKYQVDAVLAADKDHSEKDESDEESNENFNSLPIETLINEEEMEENREMEVQSSVMLYKGKYTSYPSNFKKGDDDKKRKKKIVNSVSCQVNQVKTESLSCEWQEESMDYPVPAFTLESPEIAYLLKIWSSNVKKREYLSFWFNHVAKEKKMQPSPDFPSAIELPKLLPEVKTGFLTLVMPLLKNSQLYYVHVQSRYHDESHSDLRIRIIKKTILNS